MFPDFICIGAERAGSTWLYKNLKKHPEIWLPPVKEIHYFDEQEKLGSVNIWNRLFDNNSSLNRRWRRILKNQLAKQLATNSLNYQNLKWYSNYFFQPRNDRWYASLFTTDKKQKTGDITPAYSTLNRESVAHIYELMPNAKIIFILRNPIQRAWSHALKRIRDRNISIASVSEAEFIQNFNSNTSRSRSSYLQILEVWQSYYSQENFFIGFFEDMVQQPEDFLLKLFDFLEIKSSECYIRKSAFSKKNTSENTGEIPNNLAKYLAKIYHQDLQKINQKFGSHSSIWLEDANKILA